MKPCKSCNRTEPHVHFSDVMNTKNGKAYPLGKKYVTCDECRAIKQATPRVCSKCKVEKTIADFYVKGGGPGLLQSRCKECYNFDKRTKCAVTKAAASAQSAPADDVAAPVVNAFHWRTFVQPVPMKASKWEQQPRPDQAVNTRFTQYQ